MYMLYPSFCYIHFGTTLHTDSFQLNQIITQTGPLYPPYSIYLYLDYLDIYRVALFTCSFYVY